MAQNDIYQVAAKGNLYGVRVVNVFHFRVDGVPSSGTEAEDIATGFEADILPEWMACVSEQFTLHCLDVRNISDQAGNPETFQITTGNVGLVEEVSLPANKVAVAALYTATYSRNGRGRKYFAGIPAPHEADNAILQSVRSTWEQLAAVLQTVVTGGDGGGSWAHVVWSPSLESGDGVVKCVVGPQVHSLRGRTPARC